MKSKLRGGMGLVAGLLLVGGWVFLHVRHHPSHPILRPADVAQLAAQSSVARAVASGLVSNALPVFPPDATDSAHPVERAVAQGTVLDERTDLQPGGNLKRVRLVRSAIMPNPLLATEKWRFDLATQTWSCQTRELFLADQLILQVRPGIATTALQTLLLELSFDLGEFIAPNVCTVRLPEAGINSLRQALATLSSQSNVVTLAEADGVGFGGGIPNDPSFTSQWGVHNTGQSGGTVDADVDGPELWDILENTPGVVVAVLDSGLNFTHPDLQGITWTNTAEIAGDGLDNDGNGRIDDVRGWDFTNSDNNPTDDHGHGSNVTGIIAANRNNGVGIAGMLGGVKILVCKVLNSSNAGSTSALIAATTYARQMGVPIMNLSLQSYPFNSTLNTEFTACQSAGILLSICAGNQGVNNDVSFNYPSCYQQPNVIAVGNHDRTDVRWSGAFNPSNYGATNVDLYAPGRDILSPILGTDYSSYTGTSQSTPYVTAVAAMLKYLNPDWSAAQIKSCILNTVVTRPAYSGICVTGGRLNAVTSVAGAVIARPTNDADGDGSSSLTEYLAGTRMDTSASQPLVTNWLAGGLLHLSIPQVARPEGYFELVTSTNLVDWTIIGVTDFSTTDLRHGGIPIGPAPVGFLTVRAVINL
jgi:subtilisin family serine protease